MKGMLADGEIEAHEQREQTREARMIGIVSYGGYIPRLRLNRMNIYEGIGWLAPALAMVARGERAMANWDEDSVTMAVAAARDCLVGVDRSRVEGLYLASTTLPFADRLNAGIVATALNLGANIQTVDFASTQKAGTSAMIGALDAARNGRTVLVAAAAVRCLPLEDLVGDRVVKVDRADRGQRLVAVRGEVVPDVALDGI